MITVETLKELKPNLAFASGECANAPEDIYMTDYRVGDKLIWEARTGGINDWAIYICWADQGHGFLSRQGQKVCNLEHIQKLVPCDDKAILKYRY